MDKILEKYLFTVEKHLKKLPTSERVDIIKEIESSMIEMTQNEKLTPQQIVDKLGDPKTLAKAYLGEFLSKNSSFNLNKLFIAVAFYSVTGISGICIIPTLAILAPTFMLCGIITPLAGIIKLLGFIFNFEVPFVMMEMGPIIVHPVLAFITSIIVGALLYVLGHYCWRLLMYYIKKVSKAKKELLPSD